MTVLEGTGVRLRPLAPSDYPTIFGWYEDPELVSPFDRYAPETYDDFVRSVEIAGEDPMSLEPRFSIEEVSSGRLIGAVGHYVAHPVLEYIDVWYLLGDAAARGRGYGREAVSLLVDYLFRTRSVERIGATVDVANVPSNRLMGGLGFRLEGTLTSSLFHHGQWHNVNVYGLTRPEWVARHPPQ